MTDKAWTPRLPPLRQTEQGNLRRIGVELEMAGLDVAGVARLLAAEIGGQVREDSPYEHAVLGDEAGEWGVELDFEYLKQKGRADSDESGPLAVVSEAAEEVLRAGAEMLVPVEVVSPPLPMPRLADVQTLIGVLRDAGAVGSGAGFTYAFGMQFNPEMPGLDADTVTRYLKAFVCLYDWLHRQAGVDATRRLTGYAAGFPAGYVSRLVRSDYRPDLCQLIDDYLADNPTRNRALDMLPLFSHIDDDRVKSVVDDARIKSRPTLHYRLPDCRIDEPDWGVHQAWNDWLQVEHLALDANRLDAVCRRYTDVLAQPLGQYLADWATEVSEWLVPEADL